MRYQTIYWTSKYGQEKNRFPAHSRQDAEDTLREYMNRNEKENAKDVVISVDRIEWE